MVRGYEVDETPCVSGVVASRLVTVAGMPLPGEVRPNAVCYTNLADGEEAARRRRQGWPETAPTINEALDEFLADQRDRLADTTYARYADIIELLRMTLDSYGHLHLDDEDLSAWQAAFDAGDEQAFTNMFGPERIIDGYGDLLDYYLGRKVGASRQLYRDASTVTKRLAKWLGERGHIDQRQQRIAVMHATEAADNWQMDDSDLY